MASSKKMVFFLGLIYAALVAVAAAEPATLTIDVNNPVSTTEDGHVIVTNGAASYDQAIAYVLMLLALVFTYLFH
ncbi:hypothetical protein PIB30_005850 [Stylosanthes scabra]|uniref:Uncharacterized protein n=1 Tax=Stylosanthes scabra TaxID=79078 RepID=A0ABU6Z2V7_9FABA|nr:hypothetical protein [Stylosanthes scabra]